MTQKCKRMCALPSSHITDLRTEAESSCGSSLKGKLNTRSEIGIVLPTLNEGRAIGELIQEIENLGLNVSILVVDGGSADETVDIVRELQKKYENILLAKTKKRRGLGTAIIYGFRFFTSLPTPPKYIITMEATHFKPKMLLRILRASHQMYGLVVGSRYVRGGNVIGQSFLQTFISRFVNIMTSMLLGLKINDCTYVLRGYPTRFLNRIVNVLHDGTFYEVQIRTLIQARNEKLSILEVPIKFVQRGKSMHLIPIKEMPNFASCLKILQEGVSLQISWWSQSFKKTGVIISKVKSSFEEIIDSIIIGKGIARLLYRRIMNMLVLLFQRKLGELK